MAGTSHCIAPQSAGPSFTMASNRPATCGKVFGGERVRRMSAEECLLPAPPRAPHLCLPLEEKQGPGLPVMLGIRQGLRCASGGGDGGKRAMRPCKRKQAGAQVRANEKQASSNCAVWVHGMPPNHGSQLPQDPIDPIWDKAEEQFPRPST